MNKYGLSERDICTKFITPAILQAGWLQHQFREEVKLTDGRVVVRGTIAARILNPEAKGGPKRADYVLYAQPNVPLAVIEAKQKKFPVGHGMPQALDYAEMLDAPFAISSNGDGFLLHDRTGITQPTERPLSLDVFPKYDLLWQIYQQWKGFSRPDEIRLISQPYFSDGTSRAPHYYQRVAINRTIEAIAKGQKRILLVMATGTGKTYTAFQIIWRLWKAKKKKTFSFWPIATSWLTKPFSKTSLRSARSCTKYPTARSRKTTRFTSLCTRRLPARKSGSKFIVSFQPTFSILW
jgi:type I restriction enzyme R subunit